MSTDIKVQHKSGSVAELFQHDGNGEFIPVDGINPLPVAITGGNVSIVASDNIAKIGGVTQSGANVVDSNTSALRVNVVATVGGSGSSGATNLQIRDASNVLKDVGYYPGDLNVPIQGTVTISQPVSGIGSNLHTVVDSGLVDVSNLPTITDGTLFVTRSIVDPTIAETKGFVTFGIDPDNKAKPATLSYTGEALVSSLGIEDTLKDLLNEVKKSNIYLSYIVGFDV